VIASDYAPSSLRRRGRNANHQTEMMVARAPNTPMLDFTAVFLLFAIGTS
jgi:hypothetical protein